MTCKDCLHYEACDRLADTYFGYGIAQIKAHICAKFSDKSEWVHLPCKDGDRVFSVVVIGGETTIVADRVSGFIIVGDTVNVITNWYLDGVTWGYNTFPTQEEAEKALEERKKNHE